MVAHEPRFFWVPSTRVSLGIILKELSRGTLKDPEQPKPKETLEQRVKARLTGTGVIT